MPRSFAKSLFSSFMDLDIRFKILSGTMVTVFLAAIVGGVAIVQLNRVKTTVDQLTTTLAQERALAENMSVQIQRLRLISDKYIYQGQNPADLEAYNQVVNQTQLQLNQADLVITNRNRAMKLSRVRQNLEAFARAFAEIVQILAARQETEQSILTPQAVFYASQLEALRNNSFEELDFTSAHFASQARDTFGQVRLGVYQYLATGNEEIAYQVDQDIKEIDATFDLLEASVRSESSKSQLEEIITTFNMYKQGFQQIRADAARQRELSTSQLDVYGPRIDQDAAEIAGAVNLEFVAQSQSTAALVYQTRIWVLGTLALALLLGLIIGQTLSEAITAPIGELANAAKGIAAGALDQQVKVLSNDELGDLAGTFNIMAAEIKSRAESLRESETRLRGLSDNLPGGVVYQFDMGPDGKTRQFTFISAGVEKLHGITSADVVNDSSVLYNQIFDDDRDLIEKREAQALTEMTPFRVEIRFISASGKLKSGLISSAPRLGANGHIIFDGIEVDITERKQAEEALRKSEAKFRAVVENSTEGIIFVNPQGVMSYRSPAFSTITGYTNQERSKFDFSSVHPDDIQLVQQLWKQVVQTPGITGRAEYRIQHKSGAWRWEETTAQNLMNNPDVQEIVITSHDISERKWAEDAVKLSENRYRQAIVAAGMVPYYRDYLLDTETYTFIGEGILDLTGYSASEITPDIFDGLEQESMMRGTLAHLTQSEATLLSDAGEIQHWACDYRILTRDGQTRWLSDSAVQIRDEQNHRIGVIGILQDITERKLAEEQIRQSEMTYRGIIDGLAESVYVLDRSGVFIDVNGGAERMYGYSRDELIGKTPLDISAEGRNDSELVIAQLHSAYDGTPQMFEFWGKRKDNSIFPKEVHLYPGSYFGDQAVVAIAQEITERKLAEEKIRATLEEKETLLREVHHRVKNNLQVMIALIKMRRNQSRDDETRQFLHELEGQARTMSLVYEQLYQAENLSRVDMSAYLKQLTSNLVNAFGNREKLELRIDAPIFLELVQAMPCGLIINELFSNILKHAFPPSWQELPQVAVDLHLEGSTCRMAISDNGVGLPEGFDWRSGNSMGLRLVDLWATHQLGGSINVATGKGTTFTVVFDLKG